MPLPQPRHAPPQQGSSPVIRPSVNLGQCQGREKGSLLCRGGSLCAVLLSSHFVQPCQEGQTVP